MDEPQEAALRNTAPDGTVWDTSVYDTLRPGIMLSSGGALASELLTTAGIAVRDDQGSRYITVASHGFPTGRENVYHPNGNGELLGTVHDRLTDTDIALVRLRSGKTFHNEKFSVSTTDDGILGGTRVGGIKSIFDLRRYETVCMNNPFVGYREGIYIGTEMKRVPADEPAVPHRWVTNQWNYLGSDLEGSMQGSCGSAVLDADDKVVSFFRFVLKSQSGFGVGIAASTLERFGYRVDLSSQ